MSISKKTRKEIYGKYNGKCAYCGREIQYKDMQVDHFIAKRSKAGTDDISNLMPSCRMCNHYKRANSLELFRKYIQDIPQKLRHNYIYKVGIAYGNVIENEKPIEFYFEKEEKGGTEGGIEVSDHFRDVTKMVSTGKGAQRNAEYKKIYGEDLRKMQKEVK